MLSSRRSPVPESDQAGNTPVATRKTQIQRLQSRGWGCGTNDARMKLPSLAPNSATRFFRTISFRLTTHSTKSHRNNNNNNNNNQATPFQTEDKLSALRTVSSPAEISKSTSSDETRTGSPTGNARPNSSGETEKWPHIGNYKTLPSSKTGSAFSQRSLSMAAFFRRVHPGHQTTKTEQTKRAKDGISLGGTQSPRGITSDKDEVDSGKKRTFVFHGIGSFRFRSRNSFVNYKSLDDDNDRSQPLDVDTGRYSFRKRSRNDVHRTTIRDFLPAETTRPSVDQRETRATVSDGEEEEEGQGQEEDPHSSKGQRNRSFKFQRHSAIWRSFSAKSRTRSNDVLLETTELGARDSGCLEREDIELELKLLADCQQHRNLVGFLSVPDGLQKLLRCGGLPEQEDFQNSSGSPVNASRIMCPFPTNGTHTKWKVLEMIPDRQRYRHVLDSLYELNVDHGLYTEAGFVLCAHAQLCASPPESGVEEEEDRRRWEQFLLRAVEEFDLGRTWEYAIDICEYLAKIYKARFLYAELSLILQKQADLYRKILQEPRLRPCYFMVHFLGCGFPEVLSNRRFVVRTETLDDEYDLNRVIRREFKDAREMCESPDTKEAGTTDFHRGYKLFQLKPVPSMTIAKPGSRKVPDAVQFFHRFNNVSCFEVVESGEGQTKRVVVIDSSLPTISRWAEVKSWTIDLLNIHEDINIHEIEDIDIHED